jgi:threonine synthase
VTVPLAERYREHLPLTGSTPVVTLGEGSTPLVRAERLSELAGCELWLKCEGLNPTGSFKDRGMTVAVSKALEEGAQAVVCASTGNTAASAAAYAARAGLASVILQPAGAVALGKVAQARAVGARVVAVRGSFEQALAAAQGLAAGGTHVLVNSLNPHRLEGQKTAAFELLEDLSESVDVLALPYGGGGNICAYARGFREVDGRLPRIIAGEAADRSGTLATAIRIPDPVHRVEAEEAVLASGGAIFPVPDGAILKAWLALARNEGVFCEPSSAAGLAAVLRDPPRGARVVCVITGHGLKDAEAVERISEPPIEVEPDPEAIAEAAA